MKRNFGLAIIWAAAALGAVAQTYRNPVAAGDYPDPSVIRVGQEYWATTTASEWAPHFPLLYSRDLVNWERRGVVFETPPAWAKSNFWAPEIAEDNGRYFIYYTARDRESNRLAVAVATASYPGGPYTDHGPLVMEPEGSIDGMAYTDAEGVRWFLWKNDGNSRLAYSLKLPPNPTLGDVRTGLAGNLCRCTGYEAIYRAVLTAGGEVSA